MAWYWPFGKKRRAAEKAAETDLESAFAEAMLRQGDLKDAAKEMKKAREDFEESRKQARESIASQPG